MSRNIPQVRKWRVAYWSNEMISHSVIVFAPNKRFAQWAARDALGWKAWSDATKITVSLAKAKDHAWIFTNGPKPTFYVD